MMYISYIDQLERPEDRDRPEPEPILGTYCTCKAKARTLGVCAHVACALYQLGYARHKENLRIPPISLLRTILDATDCNNKPIVLDELKE
ncbi:unnamed protein product [Lasius platythorax]|uniref:SWIM-type domain-containing protein n=1 Tax=Lasius platythorax TaxID=488582 RepID=A0AAV2MYJ9_9HYME